MEKVSNLQRVGDEGRFEEGQQIGGEPGVGLFSAPLHAIEDDEEGRS